MAELHGELLQILRHALGVGDDGREPGYRNYFVTGQGSSGHKLCTELVRLDLMTRRTGNAITSYDDLFYVTDAGREAARPGPGPSKKLTSSQRRYGAWLDADSGVPFGKWIRLSPSAPGGL